MTKEEMDKAIDDAVHKVTSGLAKTVTKPLGSKIDEKGEVFYVGLVVSRYKIEESSCCGTTTIRNIYDGLEDK